jgi:hypothetical protein
VTDLAAVEAAVAGTHRREWARVLAATVRVTRDLDLAEECVQDAAVLVVEGETDEVYLRRAAALVRQERGWEDLERFVFLLAEIRSALGLPCPAEMRDKNAGPPGCNNARRTPRSPRSGGCARDGQPGLVGGDE